MNGKGWAASTARGVRMGSTDSSKWRCRKSLSSSAESLVGRQKDPLPGKGRTQHVLEQVAEDLGLPLQFVAAQLEFPAGDKAVAAGYCRRFLDLLMQPAQPFHDEFVEDHAHDSGELDPLKERLALVLGHFQHPAGKGQPAQFPIDVGLVGIDIRQGDSTHGVFSWFPSAEVSGRAACKADRPFSLLLSWYINNRMRCKSEHGREGFGRPSCGPRQNFCCICNSSLCYDKSYRVKLPAEEIRCICLMQNSCFSSFLVQCSACSLSPLSRGDPPPYLPKIARPSSWKQKASSGRR